MSDFTSRWCRALVYLLMMHSCTGVEFVPQLKTNIEASETVLTTGSNFTLLCEGNRPVHWEILSSEDESSDTRRTQEENSEQGYSVKLHLHSVDVKDVGLYICRFNSLNKSETKIQKSVYIYVKDPAKLLAPTDSFIMGNQFKNLTIPCKPSAPDVQVTLLVDEVPIIPGEPFAKLENRTVTYDPKIGFIIPNTQMRDSSHDFSCRGVLKTIEDTRIFRTSIMYHIDSLPKPKIIDVQSCDGKTEVKCEVRIAFGINFLIRWVYPNKDNIDKERVSIKNCQDIKNPNDYVKVATSTLTIVNTTSEEMGLYRCEIIDPNEHYNSDEIVVSEDCKKLEKFMSELKYIFTSKDTLIILICIMLLIILALSYSLMKKRNRNEILVKNNLPFYVSKQGFQSLKA